MLLAELFVCLESCLRNDHAIMVVSTGQMVFGILEVFGINDVSNDMRIWSDEICKAVEGHTE